MEEVTNKTLLYDAIDDLPPLVARTVELSREMDFGHSCAPNHGRLLQVLAAGRNGGHIGETGTGCGVGLAWMVSAVGPTTSLVSVEINDERFRACQEIFAGIDNVQILHGDWRQIGQFAPFDLLVLDGGGGGKRVDDRPAEPKELLVPGGTMVLDDMSPPLDRWPPAQHGEKDRWGRDLDRSREYWFNHPDLLTTEFRIHPLAGAIVATYRG